VFLVIELGGPFEKFVYLRQCAAGMQREAVTCQVVAGGGDNVIVA
jgi:hypothetical protein